MKKQVLTSFAKKFFLGNLVAAMMFLSANASVAPVRYNYEPAKTNKAALTFKGTDSNNYLTFQVAYNNPASSAFKLMITDETGEVIYNETFYQTEPFSKTFKLDKENMSKLNFSIRDTNSGETEKFGVHINAGVIENVVVSRKN